MSIDAEGAPHQEIIIVRRGGYDEDEAHHGGVWKIAFADFMTAMMCFFLVMWLINAANEQTKAALASYFNPVKLIDRNPSRKGIDDPAKTPGDLYLMLNVVLPPATSDRARELYETMARDLAFNPRERIGA